jgi:hypothetical protein
MLEGKAEISCPLHPEVAYPIGVRSCSVCAMPIPIQISRIRSVQGMPEPIRAIGQGRDALVFAFQTRLDRIIRFVPQANTASAHRRRIRDPVRIVSAWRLAQDFPAAPRLFSASSASIRLTTGIVEGVALELEYIPGTGLHSCDAATLKMVYRQLTKTIEQQAALGLYHNDINPRNAMLSEGARLRILDWDLLSGERDAYTADARGEGLLSAVSQRIERSSA